MNHSFVCAFCGDTWEEANLEAGLEPFRVLSVPGCLRCVPLPLIGRLVVYGAAERRPADAVYADKHLVRGEGYYISRICRWQHGTNVELVGFPGRRFPLHLFTPAGFVRPGNIESAEATK